MKGTITAPGHVNGKYAGEVSVHWDGESIDVSSSIDAEPAPEPIPAPDPKPPSGNWPVVDLATDGTRSQHYLKRGEVKTWELRTNGDPKLSGDINISEMTNYEKVFRRMWISETPGGKAIYKGEADGVSGCKLRWTQAKPRFFQIRAHLTPGKTYYLNITATSGPDRSGLYLTFGSKS